MPSPHPCILIIEDDPDTRFLYRSVLEQHGFRIHTLESSADVLSEASRVRPDLILVDLVLPSSDHTFPDYRQFQGLMVLRQLKAHPRTASIPAVILSNIQLEDIHAKALELGAARILSKADVPAQKLVSLLSEILHSPPPLR